MLNALCEEDNCVSEWKEDKGYLDVPEVIVPGEIEDENITDIIRQVWWCPSLSDGSSQRRNRIGGLIKG
jgi:hypothetical protein